MISVSLLSELYQHMEWADSLVWRSVPDPDSETPDENLHGRLFHVHFTQLAFFGVWNDDDFAMRKSGEFPTMTAILSEAMPVYSRIRRLLSALTDADLAKPMPVPWAKFFARQLGHEPAITSLGETMLQVALHTQYHRGQINTRIRELGGTPAMVDYIGWVWAGRPDPVW